MKLLLNENTADLEKLGKCVNCDLQSLKLSKDLTSNRNAWTEALRMAKSPMGKKYGTWAKSR